MNKARLLKLADLLEADAANPKGLKFEWGDWGTVTDPKKPVSCGTQACAMGLAALSGTFKRQGLGYRYGENGLEITFNGAYGPLRAAIQLFKIDSFAAHDLFIPGVALTRGKKAERMVARRIRNFVAGKSI
jgi:hypothetical protein